MPEHIRGLQGGSIKALHYLHYVVLAAVLAWCAILQIQLHTLKQILTQAVLQQNKMVRLQLSDEEMFATFKMAVEQRLGIKPPTQPAAIAGRRKKR